MLCTGFGDEGAGDGITPSIAVIPGRCEASNYDVLCIAHRRSSRFRVWSFGPSRNDNDGVRAVSLRRTKLPAPPALPNPSRHVPLKKSSARGLPRQKTKGTRSGGGG